MKAIPPELVGGKIVEWHSCINSKDIKEAKSLKLEITHAIHKMEPNDKMLAYFQLVSLRYELLLDRTSKTDYSRSIYSELEMNTDNYLNFMYYYATGQYEFFKGRYTFAIRSYKIAEELVEKVNDPLEKADFYYHLGRNYFQMKQYTSALSYIGLAARIFEEHPMYTEKETECKLLLAEIKVNATRYKAAEKNM